MSIEKSLSTIIDLLKAEILADLRSELMSSCLQLSDDRTLEIPEAAIHIGISKELLYKMCSEKKIPHWRAGVQGTRKPKLLFSSLALDNWKQDQMRENYIRAY